MEIENEEVKQFLLKYAAEKLDSNKLFSKTFGHNFAKKQLEMNLMTVYTNGISPTLSGCYKQKDSSIHFYTKEETERLTSLDFTEENGKLATLVHESVHAILEKTKQFCNKHKIYAGTGIQEFYNNETELGRGLNEGFTNWVVEKVGIQTNSYTELTSFIKQIELGIGEKKVMQLGKGDIRGNIAKILNLNNIQDCVTYLAKADSVYWQNEKINNLKIIYNVLGNYINRVNKNPEIQEEAMAEYRKLIKSNQLYIHEVMKLGYRISPEDITNKEGFKINELRDHFHELIEQEKGIQVNNINEFESMTFEKYLKKDFEEVVKSPIISKDDMQKFSEYFNLLKSTQNKANTEKSEIDIFKENFKEVQQRYYSQVYNKLTEDYQSGKLTGETIKQLIDDNSVGKKYRDLDIINKMGNLINPQNPNLVSNLIRILEQNEELNTFNKYSILQIQAQNKEDEVSVYSKDGIITSNYEQKITPFTKIDKDPEDFFDFTYEPDINYKVIMEQFLELKDSVEERNPDAIIRIIDKLIAVEDDGKQSYYIIGKEQLLPAEIVNEIKLEAKNNSMNKYMYPKVQKENPISKLFAKIRRKLYKNYNEATYYVEDKEKEQNRHGKFVENLSDMSQFGEIPEENQKENTQNVQEINKDEEERN